MDKKFSDAVNTTNQEKTEPPISRACSHLHNAIEDLDNSIMNLATCMSPVLSRQLPVPTDPGIAQDEDFSSELNQYIHREAERISDLVDTINRLINRIEV